MFTINTVTISGNLTRDPERIANDKGCKFAIAVNERIKKNEEWVDYANFIDVVAWGSLADQVMKQLSKGSPVGIQGRLKQDRWETDSGDKRSKVGVVAFAMFAPRSSNGNGSGHDEIPYAQSDVPGDETGLHQKVGDDDDVPFV